MIPLPQSCKALLTVAVWTFASAASAQSLPTNLDDLLATAREANFELQIEFRDQWLVPMYAAQIDLTAEKVRWKLPNGDTLAADISLLMVAPENGPVRWAWSIDNPPLRPSPALQAMTAHGAASAIDQLTVANLNITANDAHWLGLTALLFDGVEGVEHFQLSENEDGLIVAYGPTYVE